MNLGFLGFSRKLFFHDLKWNSGGLGVSRRTAPTIRCYLQIFRRFGGIWGRKVHFSRFSGKLTFQCSRNGPQNPPFCPGSFHNTFIIYSSISHQHIFRKYFQEKSKSESGFPKIQDLSPVAPRGVLISRNDPQTNIFSSNLPVSKSRHPPHSDSHPCIWHLYRFQVLFRVIAVK